MSDLMTSTPVVMSISSHDPSGGSGISADIETLTSLGCHCTPIITKLSARDTAKEMDCQVTDTALLIEQIRAVLEDINVNLFKIGDLANIAIAEALHTILNDYPNIPVVLHPVISDQDSELDYPAAICNLLLSQATITVLSKDDALALSSGADTVSACAQELMEHGCDNILITSANGGNTQISNHWYSQRGTSQEYQWERLPNNYYGAGSTLSAAVSAYLAHDISMPESIQQAQQFTFKALQKGRRIGMGKLLPDRMHWCRQ